MDIASIEANDEPQRISAIDTICNRLALGRPDMGAEAVELRAKTILQDVTLLARCAATKCLVTYSAVISLRGRGNAQNGQWLDETYAFAIAPLGFPDLTMLVVNRGTGQPSPEAFEARRSRLSQIHISDVGAEQRRCVWYRDYETVLGPLDLIPTDKRFAQLLAPEPPKEHEIARAVRNAINRTLGAGVERTLTGREYPDSLPFAELLTLAASLWERQGGRCALTGKKFELRSQEMGGIWEDKVSLDRIDNNFGYSAANVQLVTQFANRARGNMSCEEARKRLVQFG
ncbi:hypothetical protein [Rhizobium leguminosarum]|uniref:hypothetical protein n=1 Tax=Rhizobium leguminosarum TaxID=384 RepID=UPI001C968689|nr:hypothetical protein [Rhizobium leguminosarum]MBY5351190.1 hypothetical protein [Rhizobium leguminosarum]